MLTKIVAGLATSFSLNFFMLEQPIDFSFEFSAENTALSGSVIAVADGVVRVDGLNYTTQRKFHSLQHQQKWARRTGIEPVPSDYEPNELPDTQPPNWNQLTQASN